MSRVDPQWLDTGRYPYSYRMTTRFADIDPNQHINNVAMAAAFEDARVRFHQSLGLDFQGQVRSMIVSNNIAYLAEAHYPDPLDMHVGVAGIGRTSWSLASIAVQGVRICAFSKVVLVATVDSRPSPLDEAARRRLEQAWFIAAAGSAQPAPGDG